MKKPESVFWKLVVMKSEAVVTLRINDYATITLTKIQTPETKQ